MDINDLLNERPGEDKFRFHGVRAATLNRLIAQSEDGQITLWGRVEDEDGNADYEQGQGELSATDIRHWELSFNEFCDENGMVLVLEKQVAEPFEEQYSRSELLVRVEEWKVIGGLRPVFDEDGDVVEEEAFSLQEIMEM